MERHLVLSSGLIGAAVVIALFIVLGNNSTPGDLVSHTGTQSTTNENSALVSLTLSDSDTGRAQRTLEQKNPSPYEDAGGDANYTDNLINKLTANIIAEASDGKLEADVPMDNLNGLISEFMSADELLRYYYYDIKPSIHPEELVIAPYDDTGAAEDYLKALHGIIKQHYAGVRVDVQTPSLAQFTVLEDAADATLRNLYILPVPQDLAPLHAEEIALISAKKYVYGTIARSYDDPLKALIATQFLPRIDQEFAELSRRFTAYIAVHNIAL